MKNKGILILSAAVVLAIIGLSSAFIVDETEQVVITQLGKVVGSPKTSPGLYFKIPIIQTAVYFPKNLLQWDGDPGQIPTLEKTYLWVDTFARWKITDPVKFLQTVNNTTNARSRLDDIIDPAVRNFITSYPLIETVRNSNRKLDTFEIGIDEAAENERPISNISTGRDQITDGILKQAQPKLSPFGIELVDVKIKRVNYVEKVRESVYGRMIAERKQIAEKFRSEGKGEATKILGEKERMLKEITSGAYRKAQEIKGKADAEATRIFADAFGVDPEFYSFAKTLEIYSESMDQSSSLILSTDSGFLKYLKGFTPEK
jgi:modulator of FtsH protease HflC